MITLALLHPGKTIPVQNWTFDTTSTIRIGRSMDNEVVLYSAVVSRHHLEITYDGKNWDVINLGTNGTYVDDQPITKVQAKDGMVIRLASSGPKIQIHLSSTESPTQRQLAQTQQSRPSSTPKQHNAALKDTIEN